MAEKKPSSCCQAPFYWEPLYLAVNPRVQFGRAVVCSKCRRYKTDPEIFRYDESLKPITSKWTPTSWVLSLDLNSSKPGAALNFRMEKGTLVPELWKNPEPDLTDEEPPF